MAPAELEGCILDHEDVSDVCVVGVPDDYSTLECDHHKIQSLQRHLGGEVPLAFVVLSADATRRVTQHLESAEEIKYSIMKVRNIVTEARMCVHRYFCARSMLLPRRSTINISRVASSSWRASQGTLAESFCGVSCAIELRN